MKPTRRGKRGGKYLYLRNSTAYSTYPHETSFLSEDSTLGNGNYETAILHNALNIQIDTSCINLHQKITTVKPRSLNRSLKRQYPTAHNPGYCIHINTQNATNVGSKNNTTFVPSILLSNVMSLAPKIDEIRHYVSYAKLDIVCLKETWLHNQIHDNIVNIHEYNLIRRDRKESTHGGVCTFIKHTRQFSDLDELQNDNFEVLWTKIRPCRLPRGINDIVIGNVYHPPGSNNSEMTSYLFDCLS